jgi:hypothetical protein
MYICIYTYKLIEEKVNAHINKQNYGDMNEYKCMGDKINVRV